MSTGTPATETTHPGASAQVVVRETRGSFVQRFATAGGETLAADVAAVATLVFALLNVPSLIPFILAVVTVLIGVAGSVRAIPDFQTSVFPTGSFTESRVLVVFAVGAIFLDVDHALPWVLLSLLAVIIVAEKPYARVARGAIPYAVRVPGLSIRNFGLMATPVIFYVNTLCLVVVTALVAIDAPDWMTLCVEIVVALVTIIGLVDGVIRVRARRAADARITQLLTEYAPEFIVHWDAEAGTDYQLAMWLPQLDRLSRRYIVVVRNQRSFVGAAATTDQPVLLRKILEDLDAMIVPGLRVAFYVNNAARNTHLVRFSQLTHVQLNHGDSDKAPSYNPVFRMFDKNFVAGQAAIDRFAAHGVDTKPGFFEIVGRPQVAGVEVATFDHAGVPGTHERRRVLYAPTWAGFNQDSAHSSLPIGVTVVEALLARGCTVVYRPHPYTNRTRSLAVASDRIKAMLQRDHESTGRPHLWGDISETQMSVFECFNTVDAMVADVSSVVPDFLYSEKPFAVCAMIGSVGQFAEELPIAEGGYVLSSDASNVDAVLNDLLIDDPHRSARRALKTYYLGEFPPDSYADGFLGAAQRLFG